MAPARNRQSATIRHRSRRRDGSSSAFRSIQTGPDSNVRVTLEIEGTAEERGYPKDVVDTVKANARDLKLDKDAFGFEC